MNRSRLLEGPVVKGKARAEYEELGERLEELRKATYAPPGVVAWILWRRDWLWRLHFRAALREL